MSRPIVLTVGQRWGSLTMISEAPKSAYGRRQVLVRCDCGVTRPIVLESLRRGLSTSCGCGRGRTHGASGTQIHRSWENMRDRTRAGGAYQAGRPTYVGVICDPRWGTFQGFLDHPPRGAWFSGAVLARDGDIGPYSPENCEWITKSQNSKQINRKKVSHVPVS